MFTSVNLNPKGWHARLQEWTFGDVPYRNNFCPFFWLTILCMLISPFVVAIKTGLFFINKFVDLILYIDVNICEPRYQLNIEKYATNLTDLDASDLYGRMYIWIDSDTERRCLEKDEMPPGRYCRIDKLRACKRALDTFGLWKERVGEGWGKRLLDARDSREAERKALIEASLKAEARRKKFYATLVKYTHYLVYLAAGTVLIYITYWLALLGLFMYENWGATLYTPTTSIFTMRISRISFGITSCNMLTMSILIVEEFSD